MSFFPNMSTFVQIGPLAIRWYAVLMMSGVASTAYFSHRSIKNNGYPSSVLEDLIINCFLVGIVGARLWYCVFFDLGYYLANPIDFLKIYEGGLAIQGGLLAGGLYGYYYCKKNNISFFRMADIIFPNILLGQAIGRWGNFLNQEAHGDVVSPSYFDRFPTFIKEGMHIDGLYYAPTFLYESVLNLIGFFLIKVFIEHINVKNKTMKRGDGLYLYFLWYGWSRLIVESMRTDSLMFMGLRMAQVISVIFIVVGYLGYVGVFRKFQKENKPVILFDLDGTILDTEPAIIETYRYMFKKYRTEEEFTEQLQIDVIGPPLIDMFPTLFPGHDVEELIKEYRVENFRLHETLVKPIDGAIEVLEQLKKDGYHMGVVSAKKKDGVLFGLEQWDMVKYFDSIIGQDCIEHPKPAPDGILKACQEIGLGHDDCIYVGDSANDIKAAHACNAYSIGFVFNKDREVMLIETKPNNVITDLREILEIVKEKKSWTRYMM